MPTEQIEYRMLLARRLLSAGFTVRDGQFALPDIATPELKRILRNQRAMLTPTADGSYPHSWDTAQAFALGYQLAAVEMELYKRAHAWAKQFLSSNDLPDRTASFLLGYGAESVGQELPRG